MFKYAVAVIVMVAVPALAQKPSQTASAMTQKQIMAFNQAVADFTAGQTAQQAGDNATAIAKYEAALPAIRSAVDAQPDNIDNLNFLANTLYAAAAAQAALGKFDAVLATYTEAAPYWRKLVDAKPQDSVNRNILAGMLVQMGNGKLTADDKSGAEPLYREASTLARRSVAETASDAGSRNLLLSALIGLSQTSEDSGAVEEATNLGRAMLADGSIDAVYRPAVEAMAGASAGAE